ncbi:MAG: hypothetical protein CMJ58_06855 [Planctomycetaceae bacterium]|nr:hypothetical protein [Planctomycetaceae bacterium]
MVRESSRGHIISDELNLAEFPLSSLGERTPKGVDELVFEDEYIDPVSGDPYPRRITVRGQKPFGLPTCVDDEVLIGCLRATKEAGFSSRKVQFAPRKFLQSLRWRTDGPAYAKLKRGLDRYATISVVSESAYWHRGKQKPVRDVLSILDRWQESGRDAVTGLPEKAFFVWGDFMWESFQAGNLRNLDYDFWLSLESPVSKRAYRFLGKRFYNRESVRFGLKHFAVNKLGMSAKRQNGQIRATLDKAHTELEAKGFCRAEFVGKGGDAEVVYYSLKEKKPVDPLVAELKKRNCGGAAELVKSKPRDRIEQAIANFDHRNAMGENRTGGWLRKDILSKVPYKFRDDYVSDEDRQRTESRKKTGETRENARRTKLKGETDARAATLEREFEEYLARLTDAQQREFREAAKRQSKLHAKTLMVGSPDTTPHYATYLRIAMLEHWRRLKMKKGLAE